MRKFIILALMTIIPVGGLVAQETVEPRAAAVQEMQVPKAGLFQRSIGKALKESRKKGEISARQAIKLRVALISPAFRARAEDLAVTQMAYSGQNADAIPRTETGSIDRAAIDWGNLITFLEKLLPLLLQLLDIFASTASMTWAGGVV